MDGGIFADEWLTINTLFRIIYRIQSAEFSSLQFEKLNIRVFDPNMVDLLAVIELLGILGHHDLLSVSI